MTGEAAPRVLGIAGSPRRGGNSDHLLEACLQGARLAGAHTDLLVVAEADIAPCRGCNSCSSTGECAVRDGMQDAYALIDAADAIVVASPVYFATVPAVLKALYDRCQPYWARRYVLKLPPPPRRPAGLLVARSGGDPFGSEAAVTTTRRKTSVAAIVMPGTSVVSMAGRTLRPAVGSRPAATSASPTVVPTTLRRTGAAPKRSVTGTAWRRTIVSPSASGADSGGLTMSPARTWIDASANREATAAARVW